MPRTRGGDPPSPTAGAVPQPAARFPAGKTLEESNFDHQRSLKREAITHLDTLDCVEVKEHCDRRPIDSSGISPCAPDERSVTHPKPAPRRSATDERFPGSSPVRSSDEDTDAPHSRNIQHDSPYCRSRGPTDAPTEFGVSPSAASPLLRLSPSA